MSLRMVLGRASTNHSEHVMKEIQDKLRKDPEGNPIFYIVPEQMTFQQEYSLFGEEQIKGSVRAQVTSFSRLAWRVLQETGGGTKQFISSTGIQMMLRKIVDQRMDQFQMFQKAVDKQGFIQELERMITEFKRHCITPDMLEEQMTYTEQNVPLMNKLSDLYYIYDELIALLKQKYIDGEDQLQLLAEKVSSTPFLQGAEIYLDGFYRFTPNELEIVSELLKTCKQVTIALTADPSEMGEEVSELDLFYQTKETYHYLQQIAVENQVFMEDPIILESENGRLCKKPHILHLERHFDDRPTPVCNENKENPILLNEAVHPRAELDGVIQEILRLVREENYRYRDMAMFIRETEEYHDLINTMFADYGIPVFVDEKRTMLNHPLIEFVRSLFDIIESNWRYDAIFRLLKTGFLSASDTTYPLNADAIDELENYVLEYGIRGKQQWFQKEKWVYKRFQGFSEAVQTDREREEETKINRFRKQIVDALHLFDKEIRERTTVKERAETIYMLLSRLNIPLQLEERRTLYDENGKIEKAREEEQVWNAFIQLLDEMVEMIGEEEMSFSMFRKTFEAGLESLQFSHVPPSMDHVIVGTIDHSRIASKKCVFLLGVNEGAWPMKPANDGIINENEREFLKQFGMELAESSRRILLDDNFYMYLAFTLPTDYLWVSYVLSDNEGRMKTPSPMIGRLQEFFPSLKTPFLLTDPDELQEAARFITTPVKTRGALTAQLSRYLRGYHVEDVWWNVLEWYVHHEEKYETTYHVLQSLFYENKPVSLAKNTVEQLYPKQVKTSVSRLEMLNQCSYRHYLQYSLNLEERRTYKLDAPDIGQLFHEALKTITEWIQAEKRNFADLSKDDSEFYAKKSISHLAPILQHHILSSSNRYKYIQRKLQDVIAQATYILSEQARASGFSPVGIELGFGFESELEPMKVQLPNGYELILRGRIDRVDQSIQQDNLYLRIIDYKSSSRGLDLVDVYYGLALQMLTYLDVVLSQSEQWLGMQASPGGILYFHVHNAMLSKDDKLDEDQIINEIFKRYKMTGLITSERDVARLMDTTIETGRSDIVPIGFKRDGDFYAGSKVADDETFSLLRQHIHRLIRQAGINITSGKIELNPFESKDGTACRFCSFKSVCQFDPILKENNYRKLIPMKDEQVLEKMEEKYKEE
ncbi:helicase-exonuclease AddAB subunit AddB [Pseudogracilibacillus sp. SE30717A]|uniref:helicase-exonuclease AddAB subunit AddB n=1 Tax=Pseudogracilibacillus sp. SE30717A TaxID=3098293 RepID=UPI00300DEC2B